MYQEKGIDRNVFRAYDIRGVIDEDFNEDAYYTIGRAIATRLHALQRESTYLARDARLTSFSLAKALQKGLQEGGIQVVDLGALSTPVMYFATCQAGIDSGLMVTGSHNPANYNGIKMILAGKTLVQDDIDILYDSIQMRKFIRGEGSYTTREILIDYIQRITDDIVLSRPLKVVVDCGNGIAGSFVPGVIASLGCEVIPLYCDVDGSFPNHHPDPSIEENLLDLKKAVLAHRADIGLAFDGDADRLGVITNKATVIWPDRLMMYYAQALLKQTKEQVIVYDVKCSANLERVIQEAGGVAKMCPTGHSIVKGFMKQENAALAGEMSGHLFFKDRWYGFDDALYSACRLLEIISQSELSVDDAFLTIPDSTNTPEIKISIAEEKKFPFMQRFCTEAQFKNANLLRIDGLRVEFSEGWGLVRASNTTPCLVLRFEAQDEASLMGIMRLFKEELLKIDEELELPW